MKTSINNTLPESIKSELKEFIASRTSTDNSDTSWSSHDQDLSNQRLNALIDMEITPLRLIHGIGEAKKIKPEILQAIELKDMLLQATEFADTWGSLLFLRNFRAEHFANEQLQPISIDSAKADKLMSIVAKIVKQESERDSANSPDKDGLKLSLISMSVLGLVNALMVRECSDLSQYALRSEQAKEDFFKKLSDENRFDQDTIERIYDDTISQFDRILKEA